MAQFTQLQLITIQEKFKSSTGQELFLHLVENHEFKHQFTTYRTMLYENGFYKCSMRRWSKAETLFLKENYTSIGNVEIAKLLSTEKRIFTKRQVQKKIRLLKIVRTESELENILQRNKANGAFKGNYYKRKNL